MSKISRSLSRKLSIGIMLMAIPFFVLMLGLFYLQSRHLIRQEAVERSNSILRTVIQRVSSYMSTIEASANANASLFEEYFRPDSLQSVSKRVVSLNPYILSCSVSAEPDMFPQYGKCFSIFTVHEDDTITSVIDTEYEYFDKPLYKGPLNTGKACWIEPFSEHTEGTIDHNEAVATYCLPLRSETGQALGVVATDFSFSHLAKEVIATEHPYPDAYFVLVGSDGRYLIHPDTTRLFRKTVFTDADPHRDADRIALGYQMIDGKQGVMHVTVDGRQCHVCYHRVPGTDWSLAMVCPESEVLTGYHRLAYVIVVLIILGLVVMVWLSQRVVRQNIRPVHKLLAYTRMIESGRYDEVIPRSDRNDDIGQLQNSFATMQQALHNHMGSIRQTADAIKKRNEQRAHDMQQAEAAVKKKTQFIQNLSHQIRTPLNIITGFANVLYDTVASRSNDAADRDHSEENLSDMTSMMKYNAIHLKRMVLMLFDSSSLTGADELIGNRNDEVSCNQVARDSIGYTLGQFQRLNVAFESELSDAVFIRTNRIYLIRTIRELLYNAAKYSDGKHISLHISETDTTVRFTIQDVGPGLSDNAEELIYKPFVKIDDLSDGLGLGLPLCKRHALSLGGDLIYDASYRDGCRFIVEIPK